MEEQNIRMAIDRHWAASAAGDQVAEHQIYHDDVVCEYPQSGEVIRGRSKTPASTSLRPSEKIDWASTVAVVVPSPALSLVFDATSRTIWAPMFSSLP